jgi:aryl-alcohol dehydrogenase-like predicted oxidoreductase
MVVVASTSVSSAVSLPRLGLGMAALGRPGYINLDRGAVFGTGERTVQDMQLQANLVLDQLFSIASTSSSSSSSSMPWLDCARSYGMSEKFVGEYLRDKSIDPAKVYVSSKWGYTYVADWKVALAKGASHEVKDHSTENFLKQLQETQENIGEHLDLYQIHSATFESGILSDGRAHQALADCRKNHGWSIGLSLSSPNQDEVLKEAMKIQVEGSALFDSVQCTFNVLEQKPGPALVIAHEAGLDIIIKEGLANGRALQHPAVVQYAAELSCEPDQLALGCILAQPFQPRVLSGAVTPAQLESNWKSLELSEQLQKDPALLQEIMQACVVDSKDYWDERSALAWN